MKDIVYIQFLRKNIERNYLYIAYSTMESGDVAKSFNDLFQHWSNGSLDLRDFEEKTGIVWSGKGAGIGVDYDENTYFPKIIMDRKLFNSIKYGV